MDERVEDELLSRQDDPINRNHEERRNVEKKILTSGKRMDDAVAIYRSPSSKCFLFAGFAAPPGHAE